MGASLEGAGRPGSGIAEGAVRHADGSVVMGAAAADAHLEGTGGLPEVALDLSGVTWREVGPGRDPGATLRASVRVLGAGATLEAHAVWYRGVGGARSTEPAGAGDLMEVATEGATAAELWLAHGMEGHAETVAIGGRRYVLFMSPACL